MAQAGHERLEIEQGLLPRQGVRVYRVDERAIEIKDEGFHKASGDAGMAAKSRSPWHLTDTGRQRDDVSIAADEARGRATRHHWNEGWRRGLWRRVPIGAVRPRMALPYGTAACRVEPD
jgi:hypothetical protein